MKIYIASSWKNCQKCLDLSGQLRDWGHEVDCFCDASMGRYVFDYRDIGPIEEMDTIAFLDNPQSQAAFQEDQRWLNWCDAVVMVLPCGKSAHLEAGYAKGQNKFLVIYGPFVTGEVDVMYGFADDMVREGHLDRLKETLSHCDQLNKSLDQLNKKT